MEEMRRCIDCLKLNIKESEPEWKVRCVRCYFIKKNKL